MIAIAALRNSQKKKKIRASEHQQKSQKRNFTRVRGARNVSLAADNRSLRQRAKFLISSLSSRGTLLRVVVVAVVVVVDFLEINEEIFATLSTPASRRGKATRDEKGGHRRPSTPPRRMKCRLMAISRPPETSISAGSWRVQRFHLYPPRGYGRGREGGEKGEKERKRFEKRRE